jgi:hypothetical protein
MTTEHESITLTASNRDAVIALINRTAYHAEALEDSSPYVIIDLPAGGPAELVEPGETVTLTDTAITIGREIGGREETRATIPLRVHEHVAAWEVSGPPARGGYAADGPCYVPGAAAMGDGLDDGLGDEIATVAVSVDPVNGGLVVDVNTVTTGDPIVPVTFILNGHTLVPPADTVRSDN